MSATYINPKLPSMIRGLYRADLREKSIQNMLDLAADLVQELIDLRAAAPILTDEQVEVAARWWVTPEAWGAFSEETRASVRAHVRECIEAALSTERGEK